MMENKNAISAEDTARIFMQYWGQPFRSRSKPKPIMLTFLRGVQETNNGNWVVIDQEGDCWFIKQCYLEVKSLEGISEEDESECDKIYKGNSARLIKALSLQNDETWTSESSPADARKLTDFLRSRGYALPYGQRSVEQLVEFGIFKLIE